MKPRESRRLWSLWDIVNYFNLFGLCVELSRLQVSEDLSLACRSPLEFRPADAAAKLLSAVESGKAHCVSAGLIAAANRLDAIALHLKNPRNHTLDAIEAEARHAKEAILHGLFEGQFVFVRSTRWKYKDAAALFGQLVMDTFSDATTDIVESPRWPPKTGHTWPPENRPIES